MTDEMPDETDGETPDDEPEQAERASGPRAHKPVVVVVEPETPGNIGTIARAMKNFGLYDLKLVNPPELHRDGEAYGFAGHAREDVLPNAETVTFEDVVQNYHTVGFTGITNESSYSHDRFPFKTPVELKEDLKTVDTKTALVFGREGKGLSNDELAQLDEVASIPADSRYPILNLGQAATVVLYELRDLTVEETQLPDVEHARADEPEIDRLYDYFAEFLDASHFPEHQRDRSELMFRRLFGRAHPTDREVKTLLGLFRRANEQLREREDLLDELGRTDRWNH
ncbi:RNA methyltransferase, TrmH family, group 1 [Halogranum rubrum]|uniref:RNA methyltransferase, TrmH family, group 1 n=1 Tax=Halogranum rubrum TaxID=553466 RepID=A0A1I4D5I7_9EURY|nr:RNA methyltransferase [Halogranum rubrum]SFK88263.1 RNA methyltransferase, TrmH family, group 1 [Halogranum rubrum]